MREKEEIMKRKIWKQQDHWAAVGKRENTVWTQPAQHLVEKLNLQELQQSQEPVCGCSYSHSLDYPSHLGNGEPRLPTAVRRSFCVHLISDVLCLGHTTELRKRDTSFLSVFNRLRQEARLKHTASWPGFLR